MMLRLSLLIGYFATSVADQECSWTHYPDKIVDLFTIGGSIRTAETVKVCEEYCLGKVWCRSFSYNSVEKACWIHNKNSPKVDSPGVDTYDRDCPAIRDVVPITGHSCGITTNYPGPVSDLYNSPNGVTWNYQIAHFGFVWPQYYTRKYPLGRFVSVERITFFSSDNLAYFRVVFKKNNGQVVTTGPIGPNDKDVTLTGVDNVKRVDFYVASVDFGRNVSLIDVGLKCSFEGPVFGNFRSYLRFDVVDFGGSIVPFGIVKRDGTSHTFSVSIAQDYPFIELNLSCSRIGIVPFKDVGFGMSSSFDIVVINVWNGDNAVTVYDNDSLPMNFFHKEAIVFGRNVNGNRIRSTLITNAIPNQGISGTISFTKYKVNAILNWKF